jgi:tetratricopeptide (TPR) repeat protein
MALIKAAMPVAEENEHFTMLLQLLKWLRRIMIRKGQYDEVAKQNASITAKEKYCLAMLDNQLEYKDIQAQFLALLSQKGNARHEAEMDDFKRLIKSPYLKDEKKALTYGARLLYFDCWSWYYQHTLQVQEAYLLCKRMVKYIEENPDKMILHPQAYMAGLSSLANRCTNIEKFDEALKVIEKMEHMHEIKGLKIPKSLQTEILTFSVERRLMIYGFDRQFKKGIEWYEKTKGDVERNKKALRPTFLSMYHQLAALCYVHNGDYDKALKHLRTVLDEVDDRQRSDTFLYSHMLHIITHFELKNYQLLPYLIKSVQRFAKSRNFIQQTVVQFLKMFGELSKHNSKKQMQEILRAYYPKFAELNKENSESVIIGTIDLQYWIEQKLK